MFIIINMGLLHFMQKNLDEEKNDYLVFILLVKLFKERHYKSLRVLEGDNVTTEDFIKALKKLKIREVTLNRETLKKYLPEIKGKDLGAALKNICQLKVKNKRVLGVSSSDKDQITMVFSPALVHLMYIENQKTIKGLPGYTGHVCVNSKLLKLYSVDSIVIFIYLMRVSKVELKLKELEDLLNRPIGWAEVEITFRNLVKDYRTIGYRFKNSFHKDRITMKLGIETSPH